MGGEGLFRIGEVARLYGVSVSTLRHYERLNLLWPEYIDPETGYRYYSVNQFEPLDTIRYLRQLGLPLPEIASFINNRSLPEIQRMLELQLGEVRERQRELASVERQILNRLEQLAASPVPLGTVAEGPLAARSMAVLERSIYPEDAASLELAIRELVSAGEGPGVFLGKIGLGVSAESLAARRFRPCDFLFAVLESGEAHSGRVLDFPAAEGLSIRFAGGHELAAPAWERLFERMDTLGLAPGGPALEITMIDYGLTNDTSEFLTEIQLPVKRR